MYDFGTSQNGAEKVLSGHGGDVRSVDWHPSKGIIASGSKDSSVKLWEPRMGGCVGTLHGHKSGVHQVGAPGSRPWDIALNRGSCAVCGCEALTYVTARCTRWVR